MYVKEHYGNLKYNGNKNVGTAFIMSCVLFEKTINGKI